MKKKNHPFHLVDQSPWPFLTSLSVFSLMLGLMKWFHLYNSNLLIFSLLLLALIAGQWWRDIIRESTFQGHHTLKVVNGLRWGMILFIISEVFFFLGFFWAFFHSSLSPSIELGMTWPPKGILTFNPMEIPLLNTLILVSSGLSITWTHHSILENDYNQSLQSLGITILLGCYFSALQIFEYKMAPFSISDGIYGSTFFMTTGLHGLHVIIGTTFLLVCLIRLYKNHFSSTHHLGFEMAAWYWHFVDVVWLFLYLSIYWWGS
uniref:Cytochrome c oxidase subunit 3 n=1 Tax=Curculionoidea sp. 31 KM-2017 TaxID=2219416 RepID=A0A346RJC8_9CUCU|nr:cytochrome c oxidase subunit 3 [Curculionoidea sp. 31 KM-2017]